MFRVLTCLTVEHDWQLVVLAGLVCFLASIVAINIFHRAIVSHTRTRLVWIAIAGGAIGYGIWATHFIAMLAYDPGVTTGYGLTLTALSLAAAMAITSGGFGLAAYHARSWRPSAARSSAPASPACITSACGRLKCRVVSPGPSTWCWYRSRLAYSFGFIALTIAVRVKDRRGTFAAALFLTLAIVSHHFTAMGAVVIVPDPVQATSTLSLSSDVLALAIAGVALSVLGMSLIGVLADRSLASRTDKFEKIILQLSSAQQQIEASQRLLEQQKLQLDTALDHMAHGLCMFDRNERLIVCNERYSNMYGLTRDHTKPGTTLRAILEARAEAGTSPSDVERYIEQRLREVRRRDPYYVENELRDGRIFASIISRCRMADGFRFTRILPRRSGPNRRSSIWPAMTG